MNYSNTDESLLYFFSVKIYCVCIPLFCVRKQTVTHIVHIAKALIEFLMAFLTFISLCGIIRIYRHTLALSAAERTILYILFLLVFFKAKQATVYIFQFIIINGHFFICHIIHSFQVQYHTSTLCRSTSSAKKPPFWISCS